MIVRRSEFEQILAEAKCDRMGFVGLSEMDTAKVVTYARGLLPVLSQAQRLFTESGGADETPCQAALALAMHAADPDYFRFASEVEREHWLVHLRWRARTPLPIARRRRWWFWGRV